MYTDFTLQYAIPRHGSSPDCTHRGTNLASFVKLPAGSWRAIVRRKSRLYQRDLRRKDDARAWALVAERQIDRGGAPKASRTARLRTFGDLIDLHIEDMKEVGRARAEQGAGPVTLGIDIGTIKLVLSHAAAVHGVAVPVEPVDLARIALKRLGLVGKGNERDRRPTDDELARLIAHFDGNPRQIIPMGWIIKFAVATAMRQEEICRVTWSDLNTRTKMLTIRDRKDPREKKGNDPHPAARRLGLRRPGPDRGTARHPRQRG